MTEENNERPLRQAAGALGGLITGFVLGDAGWASNGVGTVALAIGVGLLGFALVR